MLEFIGTGSAFNTSLGNNSAFIRKGNILFMIDCGSSTYSRLLESDMLDGVNTIYVLITHTHPDHIGSLGDLVFHGYYNMGTLFTPSVRIMYPKKLKVPELLELMGVDKFMYHKHDITDCQNTIITDNFTIAVEPVPVNHVPNLYCYGYIIKYENEVLYYSGDSNAIPADILKMLYDGKFDYFYQDTCYAHYEGNVHLSLQNLESLIGYDFRDKVYCMHLDNSFDISEAQKLGFNVVKPINAIPHPPPVSTLKPHSIQEGFGGK